MEYCSSCGNSKEDHSYEDDRCIVPLLLITEPPDGTRLEFQEYGHRGGDLIGLHRDDKSSAEAGYSVGPGGKTWCEYGRSVPITWAQVLAEARYIYGFAGATWLVPVAEREHSRAKFASLLNLVEAAKVWRACVAGQILGSHEIPLADAVDALPEE